MEIRNKVCNRKMKVLLFLMFLLFLYIADIAHGFTGKAWKVPLS